GRVRWLTPVIPALWQMVLVLSKNQSPNQGHKGHLLPTEQREKSQR
uniref:Uncharacterized protein n=1 Tax=Macaca fascicularis TaxID=9541 RepID=A0A7N9CBG0_MACFA